MKYFTAIILLMLAISTTGDNVNIVQACAEITKIYPNGAAEYIAELLGRPYVPVNEYVKGESIGSSGDFHNVIPGDVVGIPGSFDWLAIYSGYAYCPCMFLDVPFSGGNVRCWKTDYGPDEMFQYSYPMPSSQTPGYQNVTGDPVTIATGTVSDIVSSSQATSPVTRLVTTAVPTSEPYPPTAQGNYTELPSNITGFTEGPTPKTTGEVTGTVPVSNVTAQTPLIDPNSTDSSFNQTSPLPVTQSLTSVNTGPVSSQLPPVSATTADTDNPTSGTATIPPSGSSTISSLGISTTPSSAGHYGPLMYLISFSVLATFTIRRL